MSALKSFLILIGMLGYALWGQTTRDCSCTSITGEILYQSMPSDTSFPDPSVIQTIQKAHGETVRMELSSPTSAKRDQVILLETSDGGLSWATVRQGQRDTINEKRFGSLVYRYGNTILQRSRDGGKHLERPLFRVEGKDGQLLKVGDEARIRFIFSAIHPQRPTTLYGCFEPVGDQDERNLPVAPGLYVSFDAGDNWSLLTEQVRGKRLSEGCPLGISPSTAEIMIAHGLKSVIVSRDGGRNWEAVAGGADLEKPAILKGYKENLADLKKQGVSPDKEWPFDWTYLIVTQISFLPGDQNVAFLVTNKGIYRTKDGTRTWCLLDIGPRKLFEVHNIFIDPSHRDRIYVGATSKVLVSDDLGGHFRTFFDSEVRAAR